MNEVGWVRGQEEDTQFANLLSESIREGLKNVLGESGMQATLFYLGLSEHFGNLELFHNRLHSMFKDGAVILEKIIVKELFRRLNLSNYGIAEFNFESYVSFAKEFFESRKEARWYEWGK